MKQVKYDYTEGGGGGNSITVRTFKDFLPFITFAAGVAADDKELESILGVFDKNFHTIRPYETWVATTSWQGSVRITACLDFTFGVFNYNQRGCRVHFNFKGSPATIVKVVTKANVQELIDRYKEIRDAQFDSGMDGREYNDELDVRESIQEYFKVCAKNRLTILNTIQLAALKSHPHPEIPKETA